MTAAAGPWRGLLHAVHDGAGRIAVLMAGIGAAIVAVQTLWIAYGVVMRYVFKSPDRLATEATALLLLPVAFVGLAYALREDAIPKVTILADLLQPRARRVLDLLNLAIMVAVGAFFSAAGVRAVAGTYLSGAASEILVWPKFAFWLPAAAGLLVFTAYAALKAALLLADSERE